MVKIIDPAVAAASPQVLAEVPPGAKPVGALPVLRFFWDFGDGTQEEGSSLTHTYTLSKNYRVKLVAEGFEGQTENISDFRHRRAKDERTANARQEPASATSHADVRSAEQVRTDFRWGATLDYRMNSRICCGLFALAGGLLYISLHAADRLSSVELRRDGNRIEVTIGGHPFTTYYFGPETAKAYLQPLRSAQGTVVTRGFPIGNSVPPAHEHDPALEPHQRPMYFAHGNIDGLNFWGEQVFQKYYGGPSTEAYGRMVFRALSEMRGGTDSGVLRADFDLESPSGRRIAQETQAFTFRGDDQARTIDCEFVIEASYGPVVMGDTKEGTFGIRLAPELNSPPGRMVNSNGGVGEKEIWGTRADWVDYSGTVDGEPVGIAVFDNPKSFRHPTYWHARAYGLFSANPFGIREFTRDPAQDGSWTIIAGQPLVLHYRVLIHHGDDKQARVAEAYQRYAAGQ